MTPASTVVASKVKGLNCPNCGGALAIRGFEHTLSVVCPQCLSILDAKDPNLQVLQKFKDKTRVKLLIPLGSRGTWGGAPYEAIGFQQRTVHVSGTDYSWGEYLLFNPYKGFRYITEYNGHWNDVRTLRAIPKPQTGFKPRMNVGGISYAHFSTSQAKTTYVLGEFPWQAKRGETVVAKDYIDPPRILSSETTAAETVWSLGEYVAGDQIWKAFKLAGSPPKPVGVFANQPNPLVEKSRSIWRLCRTFLLIALAAILLAYTLSLNQEVFRRKYTYRQGNQAEASFVTPVFDLKGRTSNVEVTTRTDLSNNWAYVNYALINEETGEAFDFGREISYYSGRDSDGSWTEGSIGDTATIPKIPSGRYYLRVEPEMEPGARSMDYEIRVKRDVPHTSYFWIVAILLPIPPFFVWMRKKAIEGQRWQESDYGGDD